MHSGMCADAHFSFSNEIRSCLHPVTLLLTFCIVGDWVYWVLVNFVNREISLFVFITTGEVLKVKERGSN